MTRGIKHELQSFGTFGPASGGRMIRAAARCALALIAGASFFSCGGSEEGARSTGQKRILLYDTGIEEVNQRMWHTAIDRFEKAHPGVKVDFKPYKDDEYSQGGILIAALRSKTPPDVYFEWAWSGVERDAANGTSIDISPYLKPEFSEKFAPQAWAGAKYKEKPYLLPMTFEVANLIFYRKKALADHGIEPPKTWEEFLSVCKKLKGAGIQPIFQGNQAGWPAGNWAAELAAVYLGAEKYKGAGEVPPKVALSDPGFVRAVTRIKELREAGAFNPDINTLNDNEGIAHFASGEGAFIFAGSWTLDSLKEAGGADAFGILPRPALPDEPSGARYILANSSGYMINSKTPDKELAFDLLRHLMSLDVQKVRIEGGLNSTLLDGQKEIKAPLQLRVLEVLNQGGEWVAAPDISWNRFTAERFYEAVKQVVGGEAEPLAALQAAERDVAARAQ